MLETEEEIAKKWAKEYFGGKKLLLLSGAPRQSQKEAIKVALGLSVIDWPDLGSNATTTRLEGLVNKADIVIINANLNSHPFIDSVERLVADSGKLVTVVGYSSSKIIEESFKQLSPLGTLTARAARASQRKSLAMLIKLKENPELKKVYAANARANRSCDLKKKDEEIPLVSSISIEKSVTRVTATIETDNAIYQTSKRIAQEIAQNLREVQRKLELAEQSKSVILEQVNQEFETKLETIKQERQRALSNLEEGYYNQNKEAIDKVNKLKFSLEYAELLVVSQE